MIISAKPGTVTVIPATIQQPKPGQPYGKKLRVAAYCRVSSEKDEQLNSFEVQVGYYTEKIASNPEWKNAGIFADEGISGTSLRNRDEFKRMLRHCREGRIDLILVKSVSRFGRNTMDVLDTVRNLLKRNIGVRFEKENLDTREMGSEMMLAFHAAFSQSESESTRGNIMWGQEKRRQNGIVTINPGMFGFCRDADGQISIDEGQAAAIRVIYQAYLDGDSLIAIKHRLEAMGVKTASGREKWNTAVIQNILSQEKYKGDALLQKTYKASLFDKRARVNNGEMPKYYVTGCLPAIVTPELYDRVQEEVARRKAKRATSEKVQNPLAGKYSGKYALSELLVCGKCGAPYRRATWAKKGKKKIVWRCGYRLDYGTQFCKDSPTLEENALHDAIMRGIAMQYIDKDADIQILQANLSKALAPQPEGGIADVRTRLAELNQQKQELVMRCLDENDDGKYDLLLTNIVTEMRSLQERLGELEKQEDTNKLTEARLAEINELLERFSQQGMAYDDTLVRKVVGTIHVKSAEEIEITFRDGRKICCPLS